MVKPNDAAMLSEMPHVKEGSYQEHVKRPMNAFMIWAKTERRRLAMTLPGMPNSEVSKILGGLWKRLSDEDKRKYRQESESIRKQHRNEHPDYRYHPKRRAMKGAGKKVQKVTGLRFGRHDDHRRGVTTAREDVRPHTMGVYAQQQTIPYGQCMYRQTPEAYLSWATTTAPMAQGSFTPAPAGFYPAFVGHAVTQAASSRPATISFDSPSQTEVTDAASSAAPQCGWAPATAHRAMNGWSRGSAGAGRTGAWSTGQRIAVSRGDASSEVGTPPALMHATLGESPQSGAASGLCSPQSSVNGGLGSPPSMGAYNEQDTHAQQPVVPSNDDEIFGYMQLYLGDADSAEKDPLAKSTSSSTPPPPCRLGQYVSEQASVRQRSASPPFAVPQISSRQTPDNTTQLYNYPSMATCSTATHLSTPSPPLNIAQSSGSSSHWSHSSPMTSRMSSPMISQMTSPDVSSSASFSNSMQYAPPACLPPTFPLHSSWAGHR